MMFELFGSISKSGSYFAKKWYVNSAWKEHWLLLSGGSVRHKDIEIEKRGEKLKVVETFSRLSFRDLFDLADLALCQSFKKGDLILKDGDEAEDFYFLLKGDVKITKPNEEKGKPDIFITTISSPEIFGESSIFEEEKRKANVFAENDVEVYKFDRMDFLAFLNSHLEASLPILLDIVKRLIIRIGDTNRELAFERKDFVEQGSVDDLLEQLLP